MHSRVPDSFELGKYGACGKIAMKINTHLSDGYPHLVLRSYAIIKKRESGGGNQYCGVQLV
jgi:hypothetical protein